MLRVLDLFCGAGGAGMGYHLAGFDVTGIDIETQQSYPFTFIQADALDYFRNHGHEYDLIHASPPCQHYTRASGYHPEKYRWPNDPGAHQDFLTPVLKLLRSQPIPYVIENVLDAKYQMIRPVILCGTMFGLKLYRHRAFEISFPVIRPQHQPHKERCAPVSYLPTADQPFMTIGGKNGHHSKAWVKTAAEYMGMPWASDDMNGIIEAIPPAYTHWIGQQFMCADSTRVALSSAPRSSTPNPTRSPDTGRSRSQPRQSRP
jgi:DNA (cytosine-5)-methyltransferase 1